MLLAPCHSSHSAPQVVPEPVDKWQNVGNGKVNLLMEFYQNPQRFAYTFQNYVFLTRMVQVWRPQGGGGGGRDNKAWHRQVSRVRCHTSFHSTCLHVHTHPDCYTRGLPLP